MINFNRLNQFNKEKMNKQTKTELKKLVRIVINLIIKTPSKKCRSSVLDEH